MLRIMQCLVIFAFLQVLAECLTFPNPGEIRCSFQIRIFDEFVSKPYTCLVANLDSTIKTVAKVTGKHKMNNDNNDVKALEISHQQCEHFPSDFQNFFQNIEGLKIENSKLKSISKKDLEVFPKLKTLYLTGNELKTLEIALLSSNQQLKKISFPGNPLVEIGRDLMDNLEGLEQVNLWNAGCINANASTPHEIDTLKAQIAEKCSPNDDKTNAQEADMKFYSCKEQLENATTSLDICYASWETCIHEYEMQADQFKETAIQLDLCATESSKRCETKVSALETQTATDSEEIKKLKVEIVKLKEKYKDLENSYDREVLKLQACKAELQTCSTKTTPKPSGGSETTSAPCKPSGFQVFIECDKFYGTTCVSESSLIPVDGMNMGGVKLPNGTVIDGSSITELYLSGGAIRAIPDDFGKYFTNLITLVMDSVRVEEINQHSFSGCFSLKNLKISNSKLSQIHKEAFVTATSLVYVDFSNSLLTEIGEAIQNLIKLQTLILESNQITTIEWKIFKNMPNIEVISLNKNPLEHVDSGFLDTEIFTNIVSIDMSGSKCVNLKYPATSPEKIKQALRTGCPFKVPLHCEFKQVGKDYICDVNELFLYYEDTIISGITGAHTVTSNTILDVTMVVINNQIMHYIPPNLFSMFGKVTKFEVDNSGLRDINHLNGLKEVKIINCFIATIKDYSFQGSPDAEVIILTGNGIQKISENAFEKNKQVLTFDISNNNITYFSTKYIENFLIYGSTIIMSGNAIQNIVWEYTGPTTGQLFIENNPCIDMKSGKNYGALINAIQDGCSMKYELECQFKYIDEDYVCVAKNLNITTENTKITRVHGYHIVSGLSTQNVIKLIVENQHMEYFPINIAEVFPNLEKIEVTSSNLKKISKFVGQNLVWIKITGNQITKIEESSFAESIQLSYIDMSNNEITKIPKNIFEKNPEVMEVNLSHNSLEVFSWSIFKIMTSLHTIDISYNKIKQIDWTQITIHVENMDMTGNECIDMKYSEEEKDRFMEAIYTKCGAETTLTCNYRNNGLDYVCYTVNLEILNENTRITGVEGKHLAGKSNKDVTRFVSINQNVVYFPINIRKFFMSLKVVDIINTFSSLKVIFISDTEFTRFSN